MCIYINIEYWLNYSFKEKEVLLNSFVLFNFKVGLSRLRKFLPN